MLARSLTSRDAALPAESLKALDWLNFFLAAFLIGFGPFVAVHLTENGWAPASIGAVLTISGLAGLTTQVPAGELIDRIAPKRALVGVAVTAAALALTIFGLRSDFPSVAGAAIIQGAAGSVFGPSIAAISLGLVGHDALAERLGRNQRFASIGGLSAAAIMGAIGYLLSTHDIFLVAPPRWRSRYYGHFSGYTAQIFTSAGPVALPIIMRRSQIGSAVSLSSKTSAFLPL